MEILWKCTVSAEFRASPKTAEAVHFHKISLTKKLGEVSGFYTVSFIMHLSIYLAIVFLIYSPLTFKETFKKLLALNPEKKT